MRKNEMRWYRPQNREVKERRNETGPQYSVQRREVRVEMGKRMLLVALGCCRLPGILDIAARRSFVVFGTMEGKALAGLNAGSSAPVLPVYFYEIG
jgi:hypothetical protein